MRLAYSRANCATDEGKKAPRDLLAGAGLKSPWAAVVKSHGGEHEKEKAREEPGQVTDRKRTAREPLMMCRKRRDDVETAGESLTRDKLRRCLFTDRSGIRH